MVKTYLKTFARMFKRHATRLVSVFLMVVLSVGFSAGIGMATDKMRYAFDQIYHERNVSDFIIQGRESIFAKKTEIEDLGYDVEIGGYLEFTNSSYYLGLVTFEGTGDGVTRIYLSPEGEGTQNQVRTIDKAPMPEDAPKGSIPIAVERATSQLKEYALGEKIKATVSIPTADRFDVTFVVTEIVENPLHLAVRRDPSATEIEGEENGYQYLESVFYLDRMGLPIPEGVELPDALPIPVENGEFPLSKFCAASLYVSVPALKSRGGVGGELFDSGYESGLKAAKSEIASLFQEETEAGEAAILSLHENFTYESYFNYTNKVEMIGYVLMVVFVLVTLLVVLSTMTRLLDEERAQIACLMTLGYSPARILSKYLLFALIGTLIGAVGGYFASLGLAYIIYVNFHWNYSMPSFPMQGPIVFFLIVASIILVATLAATLIAGLKMTRERPAALLRPKSPRPGKKVLFERIPAIWGRISFKMKSTLRNVLRFKTRFIMTVVSVMASTGLVVAGLAVLDCCIFQSIGTTAMIVVAIVVLVFAALLNAVVIYTLTNINISERERELATLMVLGYHDKEVTLYVYREIYITSAIGIVFGIPFGAALCAFIFSLMTLGSLGAVNFYVWLVAPVMSLAFTFLATLLLRRKIVKIDMNDSLKAME